MANGGGEGKGVAADSTVRFRYGDAKPSLTDDTLVASRFRIERLAGVGGMGAVYRARDCYTSETVALKVLVHRGQTEDQDMRFWREAKLLAQLSHPRVVRHIADGTVPGGWRYLAMEWLEGEDLASRLGRGVLTVAASVQVLLHAAEALGAAHRLGLVHRDIKPSNLFLVGGEVDGLKLLDFGIARPADDETLALTQTGAILGTPQYMAPEQARGEKQLDPRTDVFALGALFFHCLAGRPPFVGSNLEEVRARLLTEDAPRLSRFAPHVPADLDALTTRMLSRTPAERPGDANAVVLSLAAVAARSTVSGSSIAISREESRPTSLVLVSWPGLSRDQVSEAWIGRCAMAGGGTAIDRGDEVLVVFPGNEGVSTGAERAARCALAIAAGAPRLSIIVSTGRATFIDGKPIGPVMDRARRLAAARRPATAGVLIDGDTASLLRDRFTIVATADGDVINDVAERAPPTPLLVAPLVGRERELGLLDGAFGECQSEGAPKVVVIVGEPGMGKTRLAMEFVRSVRQRFATATVLAGRGEPTGMGAPFNLIAGAIRDHFRLVAAESAERQKRAIMTGLRALPIEGNVEAIGQLLGEIVGLRDANEASPAASVQRSDPMLLGDRMRAAWESWLLALSADGPLLLWLDDVHWGDIPSVRFVDAALRFLDGRPLFVLALARPEVAQSFPALWSERRAETVVLGPLSRTASRRLIAGLDQGGLAASDDALFEQSGGNPFLLLELVRTRRQSPHGPLIAGVGELLQPRIDAFGADTKRVLRAASVFGLTFWADGIAALLGGGSLQEEAVETSLRELVKAGIVERQTISRLAGGAEYRFTHALFQEAALAGVPPLERTSAYREAALWLERVGESNPIVLAEAFQRGHATARAAHWYGLGAEKALRGADLDKAIAWAELAISEEARSEIRSYLRSLQAEAHYWRGELAVSGDRAREGLTLAVPGTKLWFANAAKILRAAGQRGSNDEVSDWVTKIGAQAAEPDARSGQVLCLARGGGQLIAAARYREAFDVERRLGELAPDIDGLEPTALAALHRFRAGLAFHRDDFEASFVHEAAVKATLERTEDSRGACESMILLGSGHAVLGHLQQAKDVLPGAIAVARRLGAKYLEGWGRYALGKAYALSGEGGLARELLGTVIATMSVSPRIVAGAHIYLAFSADLAGNAALSGEHARQALQSAAHPLLKAAAEAALARSLLALGRREEAAEHAELAGVHGEASGLFVEFAVFIQLSRAEVLAATGAEAQSQAVLQALRDRLERAATRIPDPVARDNFLHGHPYHDRALRLSS